MIIQSNLLNLKLTVRWVEHELVLCHEALIIPEIVVFGHRYEFLGRWTVHHPIGVLLVRNGLYASIGAVIFKTAGAQVVGVAFHILGIDEILVKRVRASRLVG